MWVPFGTQFLLIFWNSPRGLPRAPMSRFGAHLAPILALFWEPFSGPCPKWPKREFAAIYHTSATSGPPIGLKKVTFSRSPFDSPPGGLPILSFYINLWILDRFRGPLGTPFSTCFVSFSKAVFHRKKGHAKVSREGGGPTKCGKTAPLVKTAFP